MKSYQWHHVKQYIYLTTQRASKLSVDWFSVVHLLLRQLSINAKCVFQK